MEFSKKRKGATQVQKKYTREIPNQKKKKKKTNKQTNKQK
jgi:hypothetical protein